MPWLINAAQLDKFRKSQKSLIIFDASWHMPDSKQNAQEEFNEKHIIDSQFFDITLFSDPDPSKPHPHFLLKDEALIADKLGALGIRNDYKIILYDNSKLHTACRALWMLKIFGHNHQQLYILDGGLTAWEKYGGKTASGVVNASPKSYQLNMQKDFSRDLPAIKQNLREPEAQIVDLRHAVRFAGGPEIRPDLRLGHIPNSASFPYTTMFAPTGAWRPLEKIRQQLGGVGIDIRNPIITTCGSSITAPILNFALDLLGQPNNAVYTGSWSEWGSKQLFSGETSLIERPIKTSLESF
jgi:thiosulfate/3-mercaptopyruvate sulfurtransferase